MSEENKIEETEEVKEVNPIDEYLNNYKEQKLAEFCVQKDKEIASRKEERQKLMQSILIHIRVRFILIVMMVY